MEFKTKGMAAVGMAITLFVSPGAWAGELGNDELSVQPLVVTTTMTKKSIKEAPGSVEVITRQKIGDMNAQTLAEAVENAAGLVVTMETGRNKRPSIRGTGAKHTLILIDGRRIASGFKSYTGMEQIPVDMIDHIEVVRGPASALYGSDAMGGVINVITRKTPDKFTLEATGQLGQSTYAEGQIGVGQALVGGGFGDLGVLLSGSFRHKDGYDRDNAAPDDGDDSRLGSVAGRVSYDISKFHHLLTGFEYMEKTAQGLRDLQNMDRERDADDDRLNLFLEYNGKLSPVSNLMLRANHSTHEAAIEIDPPTSMTPGAIVDENHSKRQLDQLEGRFTSLFFDRHMVTIGAEGREEKRTDDSGLAHDITNLSFLIQDEYQITDRFYLLLGGRVDEHSDFNSHFSPRASATFALMENFRIKTSAGKGFRAPDINELHIPMYMKRGKEIYQPNSDLDPEESTSFELSLEGEIQKFYGRITGFQNDISDLIEPVFDYTTGSGKSKKDYYIYKNISKARMRGVEMEAGIDLPLGFDISGNLTFLDAENKDTGESLENRPDISGFVKLGYVNPDLGIRTSLRLTHIGEREFDAGDEAAVTRADFKISKKLTRQMEFYTGVNNIANAYVDDGLEPMFFYAGLNFSY